MPGFAVDTHPQKQKIIDGILAGMTIRAISESVVPHVPPMVVQRYKTSVIKPMLQRAAVSERILNEVPGFKDKPMDLSNRSPEVQAVQKAIQDAPALSIFRQRHQKAWEVLERTVVKAESAVRMERDKDGNEVFAGADLSPIAPLVNQMHKSIEILGRATGELEPQGAGQVSIQIVLPGIGQPHEEPRISFASADAIEIPPPQDSDDGIVEIGVLQKG